MTESHAVWPDGVREAVQAAHDRWMDRPTDDPTRVDHDILTALEPFVQQRIDDAMTNAHADGYGEGLRDGSAADVNVFRAALDEIDELVPPAIGIYQTIPDRVRLVIAQRDEAESIVADLRAEVARLREDGERYEAVLRLLAVDVLYCHRGDDGVVTAFINLNDYFIPAADGEAIAMNDAPALAALYDQGGWPAISQWVADRRGIPNQHWRKRLDAARSARGEGA